MRKWVKRHINITYGIIFPICLISFIWLSTYLISLFGFSLMILVVWIIALIAWIIMAQWYLDQKNRRSGWIWAVLLFSWFGLIWLLCLENKSDQLKDTEPIMNDLREV